MAGFHLFWPRNSRTMAGVGGPRRPGRELDAGHVPSLGPEAAVGRLPAGEEEALPPLPWAPVA